MKRILLLLCFLCSRKILPAQDIYTINADSVKLTSADSSELIIGNHTQGTPGFLFNTGNGRTTFRRLKVLNDSTLLSGVDTLLIRGIAITRHGDLSGLDNDDHPQYAILTGRAGGQTLIGGAGPNDSLVLRSSSGNTGYRSRMYFKVGNNGAIYALEIAYTGNVGVGVYAPIKFYVRSGGTADASERLMQYDVSDTSATADKFFLQNGTAIDGVFSPWLCGESVSQDSLFSIGLAGCIDSLHDTNTSRYGLVDFAVGGTNIYTQSGIAFPATHRNFFSWRNQDKILMLMDSSGGLGINTTPSSRLEINGSVKINKDSVSLLDSAGNAHVLIQDTTTGRIERIRVDSLGSAYSTAIQTVTASSGTYAPPADVSTVTYDVYASSNSVSMTIGAGAAGQLWNIKRMDSSANTVTIVPSSGTIDGQSSITINTQYENKLLQWDGSDWLVL